jgi:phosphoribosylanthranilate isomerase
MRMTERGCTMGKKIKICGITREEDLQAVNLYRPDYIGFVFALSRRRVTHEKAARLAGMLRKDIIPVGVFVDQQPDEIVELMNKDVISIAQLHGGESEDVIRYIHQKTGKKVIKAVTVRCTEDVMKWERSSADLILLDNGKGTGNLFDWGIIRECCEEKGFDRPFFIAGGIGLQNIGEALKTPAYGIDLSGGAETDGIKDPEKIRKLVETVHLRG